MKKRIISLALVLILAFSLLPTGALAANSEYTDVYQGSGYYITAKKYGNQDIRFSSYDCYFSDGLIRGRDSTGDDCFLDKDGNVVISSATLNAIGFQKSYNISNFSEGLCMYRFSDNNGYGYGYIDKTGKVVMRSIYRQRGLQSGAFQEGLALVEIRDAETYDRTRCYIDKNGNRVLDEDGPRFHTNFDGGKTVCSSDEIIYGTSYTYYRFHIIDRSGRELATYSPVNSDGSNAFLRPECTFSEGYGVAAGVMQTLDVFDTDGDLVLRLDEPLEQSSYRYDFEMDLPQFSGVHGGILIYSVGPSTHADNKAIEIPSGRSVFPEGKTYTYIYDNFSDGVVAFYDDEYRGFGLVDSNGFEVVPPKAFGEIYPFNEGMGIARRDGECYLLEKHNGTWSGPLPQDTDQTEQPSVPTPTTPTSSEQPSSWAKDSVAEAVSANIVPGTLQSAYTSPTTRAEFCALATQLYETVKGTISTRAEFTDTSDVNVQKMASIGVVNGVGNGKFDPNGSLTREQAATMLARLANAMGKPLPTASASFADNSSISSWALESVGQMQSGGIMAGVGSNKFDPKGSYTREQSIITALRLYNIVK